MEINLFTFMRYNKVISIILVLEFLFALYKTVPMFLMTYTSASLIPAILMFTTITLLLISAIGVFLNKKWSVIILWVFILFPFIAKTFMSFIIFTGGYLFIVINVIIATYLTMLFFGNKKENLQSHQ